MTHVSRHFLAAHPVIVEVHKRRGSLFRSRTQESLLASQCPANGKPPFISICPEKCFIFRPFCDLLYPVNQAVSMLVQVLQIHLYSLTLVRCTLKCLLAGRLHVYARFSCTQGHRGLLESLPAALGSRQGYALDNYPIYPRATWKGKQPAWFWTVVEVREPTPQILEWRCVLFKFWCP